MSIDPPELTVALKKEALRLGFDLAGATPAATSPDFERFAQWLADGRAGEMHYLQQRLELYRHPGSLLEGAKSLLMLGMNYRTVEPAPPERGQGGVSRFAWGTDYHEVLRERLEQLGAFHKRLVPEARIRGIADSAPILEKQFGRMAGLGWIGKNRLLIHPRFGSWIFLAVLLTTEELKYDEPMEGDPCGSCRACLDACPTGALTEHGGIDARKCLSYLLIELHQPAASEELQKAQGRRLFGCDACQEVCPWNRCTPTTSEPAFQPRPGMNPVELSEILAMDEETFRRRFRHTPLWRAKWEGLRRNARHIAEREARE